MNYFDDIKLFSSAFWLYEFKFQMFFWILNTRPVSKRNMKFCVLHYKNYY